MCAHRPLGALGARRVVAASGLDRVSGSSLPCQNLHSCIGIASQRICPAHSGPLPDKSLEMFSVINEIRSQLAHTICMHQMQMASKYITQSLQPQLLFIVLGRRRRRGSPCMWSTRLALPSLLLLSTIPYITGGVCWDCMMFSWYRLIRFSWQLQ